MSSSEIQTSANHSTELASMKSRNHPVAKVISLDLEFEMITLFLKTSSLEKPLVSLNSWKTPTQSSKNTQRSNQKNHRYLNPIFERKSVIDIERDDVSDRKRRDRFRRICPLCSKCCCFGSTIALLLLLIGLAALLVFLLVNRHTTTTTTTTTTTKTSEFFIQKSISNFSLVI